MFIVATRHLGEIMLYRGMYKENMPIDLYRRMKGHLPNTHPRPI